MKSGRQATTVILMLPMFVVFLTIDYLMPNGKVAATESDTGAEAAQSSLPMPPTIVGGLEPEIGGITRGILGRCRKARPLYAWD
jgi:hypothetical protein